MTWISGTTKKEISNILIELLVNCKVEDTSEVDRYRIDSLDAILDVLEREKEESHEEGLKDAHDGDYI